MPAKPSWPATVSAVLEIVAYPFISAHSCAQASRQTQLSKTSLLAVLDTPLLQRGGVHTAAGRVRADLGLRPGPLLAQRGAQDGLQPGLHTGVRPNKLYRQRAPATTPSSAALGCVLATCVAVWTTVLCHVSHVTRCHVCDVDARDGKLLVMGTWVLYTLQAAQAS